MLGSTVLLLELLELAGLLDSVGLGLGLLGLGLLELGLEMVELEMVELEMVELEMVELVELVDLGFARIGIGDIRIADVAWFVAILKLNETRNFARGGRNESRKRRGEALRRARILVGIGDVFVGVFVRRISL